MSIQHHGQGEDLPRPISDIIATKRMLGELLNRAQRNYPSGRVSADDEGETAFAIAVDHAHRIIRIHFTKPMEWLGFDLASARHLRSLLNEKIQELEAADVPLEKGR